jgi:hypothetical protein
MDIPSDKTNAVLSFAVGEFESRLSIEPVVNGRKLSGLVSEFETAHDFEPAGGYGGLIPQSFKYGRLDQYFLAEHDSYWEELRGIYVLGCGGCGEVSCWPIVCSVKVDGNLVVWSDFRQPHRPDRDYSGLGAFVFEAAQYRTAVARLVATAS